MDAIPETPIKIELESVKLNQKFPGPEKKVKKPKGFFSKLCSCLAPKKPKKVDEASLLPQEYSGKKKTLVLDLDETLVHSSIQPVEKYDLKINIKLEKNLIDIYVLLRPGVKEFIKTMGKLYELVIFTASLKDYADPVIDIIDEHKLVSSRLFRSDCAYYNGSYIKNLSQLGRDLKKVIIIDNSPVSYCLHPYNAIPITSWFDDKNDRKLEEIQKILELIEPIDDIQNFIKCMASESIEVSPKSITVLIDSYLLGRSIANSPKNPNTENFNFELLK
jgi:carboxy-terminal domain RNA polymerase II polypeptide A small phosphatase